MGRERVQGKCLAQPSMRSSAWRACDTGSGDSSSRVVASGHCRWRSRTQPRLVVVIAAGAVHVILDLFFDLRHVERLRLRDQLVERGRGECTRLAEQ